VINLGDEAESYAETVIALEERMGERSFEAARAEGRSRTLDDAVADALELLDTARRPG
jgi:hypothetical protein